MLASLVLLKSLIKGGVELGVRFGMSTTNDYFMLPRRLLIFGVFFALKEDFSNLIFDDGNDNFLLLITNLLLSLIKGDFIASVMSTLTVSGRL